MKILQYQWKKTQNRFAPPYAKPYFRTLTIKNNTMKKILCSLVLAITLIGCSSDDATEETVMKGIVKVEMTTDNTENVFDETLTLQVVGDNMAATNVTGVEWQEVEQPHSTTKWFITQQDLPTSRTYETTMPVTSVTYSALLFPKSETATPVNGTLKFYLNGQLKRTETFVASPSTMTQVNIPFVVTH